MPTELLPESPPPTPPKRSLRARVHHVSRWTVVCILVVLVALLAGFRYLTSPHRFARIVRHVLTQATGAQVQIESAHYQMDGRIILNQVRMRVPNIEGDAGRLFDAQQVEVEHDLVSLLIGRFVVRKVVMRSPTLYVTEDLSLGRFTYEMLQDGEQDAEQKDWVPSHMPEIYLYEGTAQFGDFHDKRYVTNGQIMVSGYLQADQAAAGTYNFELQQQMTGGAAGPTVGGAFDLKNRSFKVQLDRFAIDGPQGNLLPSELRKWWRQLQPRGGEFPTVRIAYSSDPAVGLQAQIQVKDVELTIPYTENEVRMTVNTGTFTASNQTIKVLDLTGDIEGTQYVINGDIFGLSRNAPFQLTAQFEGAIPENPDYLQFLPAVVRKQHSRFSPSGEFWATVHVQRREDGGLLSYDCDLKFSHGKGRYEKFPYPLHEVSGEMRVYVGNPNRPAAAEGNAPDAGANDDRIDIVNLHGLGPTGARVSITGRIEKPGDGAGADIEITALDLPIDDELLAILKPKHRAMIEMFADREAYHGLVDQGLVQSAATHRQRKEEFQTLRRERLPNDTKSDPWELARIDARIAELEKLLAVPVFDMAGKTQATVVIKREYGPKEPFNTSVTMQMAGLGLLVKWWPYPLRLTGGKLYITPTATRLEKIEARGLVAGLGQISGIIGPAPDSAEGKAAPQLSLAAAGLPLDDLLIASIPKAQQHWIKDMHLTGALDAAGVIKLNEQGKIDFLIKTDLAGGAARPWGGRYELRDVTAKVSLQRNRVTIESVGATHGASRLALTGQARWQGGQHTTELHAQGADMLWQDSVLDLVPPRFKGLDNARKLFDDHKPAGPFTGAFDYRSTTGAPDEFTLDLRPTALSFDLHGTRVDLHKVEGALIVKPGRIELDKLRAQSEHGQAAIAGTIETSPLHARITFDASSRKFDDATRAALPTGVRKVIDGLELRSAYAIKGATLDYAPGRENGPEMQIECQARITGGTAAVGVPITAIDGLLTLEAQRSRGDPWPRLDLQFEAQRMRADQRLIEPASIHIVSSTNLDRLEIRELTGKVYGGKLIGQGDLTMGSPGRYRLSLTLQDAALYPMVNPTEPWSLPAGVDPPPGRGGTVSASLAIDGVPGKVSSRRGRGDLQIRDARLYQLPLAMALLQIINLSLPMANAFDQVRASYIVEADLVRFEHLAFESPTVEATGQGVMKYSTRELDLSLVSRNPHAIRLGPVTALWDRFKDELMTIRVTGTLGAPRTRVESFRTAKGSWRQIFGSPRPPADQAPEDRPATTQSTTRGQ